MLECLKFIFNLVIEFLSMLFTIDLGFASLGVVMCITFIFLPMVLTIINFLKGTLVDELDEYHDFNNLFHGRNKKQGFYKPKHAKK